MRWESTAAASSAAPPAEVWKVLTDARGWPEWNAGIEWVVIERELAAGGLVTIKPRGLRQTALRLEAVEPERLLAVAVTVGPVAALRLRWELAPQQTGTAIVQTVAIAGPLAGPLIQRPARRIAAAAPAALERLAVRALR